MQRYFSRGLTVLGLTALIFLALAALPAADDPPKFSPWSAPVNLGTTVNSPSYDACPTIAKNGLSLFFRSNRPGGSGGYDIYVAQRDSVDEPWDTPFNLGPTINGSSNEYCSTFSPDGHWLVFVSDRPGCGSQDLWISHRKNKRDDFGWETPVNLGCVVNSPAQENGPAWFEDEDAGRTMLYFSSARPGGLGLLDIYVSELESDGKGDFGLPSLVRELSTSSTDYQPTLSKDGLELIFASNRPGGLGLPDLWVSTRERTMDPWSLPVNLGVVNSAASDFHPTLSFDRTTLIFASERGGAPGVIGELWMSTRSKVRGKN